MSTLVIAEKPSVAKSIAAVLGAKTKKDGYLEDGGYIVSWCIGHLVALAEATASGLNLLGINLPSGANAPKTK